MARSLNIKKITERNEHSSYESIIISKSNGVNEQLPPSQLMKLGHLFPHDPQLSSSFGVSTQVPSHSILPLGQAQVPSLQLIPLGHLFYHNTPMLASGIKGMRVRLRFGSA